MKRILYFIYYLKFKLEHPREMTPVCFKEWLDNEYEFMKERKSK